MPPRKILPPDVHRGDFQDIQIWREFTYQGLRYAAENFAGIIIVPMTVVNSLYYWPPILRPLKRVIVQIRHIRF